MSRHLGLLIRRNQRIAAALALLLGGALAGTAGAAEMMMYPTATSSFSWPTPTAWAPISGLNDPDDGVAASENDFVGDSINPCAYYAADSNYLYLRMRVQFGGTVVGNQPSGNTFEDFHTFYIDRKGYGNENGLPDYGLSWDSKSNDPSNHGLEFQIAPSSLPAQWDGLTMLDKDDSAGSKLIPDINGTATSSSGVASGWVGHTVGADGYIRTVDGQSTTNFGTTTYIDFAVSWNYLASQYTAYPGGATTDTSALGPNQQWYFALGTRHNSTDHLPPTSDIAGGANPGTAFPSQGGLGWSSVVGIPEPTALVLLSSAGILLLARRRSS